MEFITTDQRIAVENFSIGKIYTITFKNSSSITRACIGKGADYVMFQEQAPKMLFTLNMQTAATVDTIEPGTGSGTNDYDDLENKPQINSVTLSGNKTSSDLGLQDTISDLETIRIGASAGATAVQPAAMEFALAAKQDTISDLETIRSGASAGATAVQPAAMETALAAKQDTLTTAQLAAVNSGIDSTKVAQIETNKNNILFIEDKGAKNLIPYPYAQGSPYTQNGITFTASDDGIVHVEGTNSGGNSYYGLILTANPKKILIDGETYVLSVKAVGTGTTSQVYVNEIASPNVSLANIENISEGTYDSTFTFNESIGSSGVICAVKISATNTNPIDMYLSIMICKKSDWDISHAYQPYAPTNRELYDMIRALSSTRSAKSVNLPDFEKMSEKEIAEYYGDTQFTESIKR